MPTLASADTMSKEVDTYSSTVWMVVAFIHEMAWSEAKKTLRTDAVHEHGSPQERPGSDPVTPDVALLVGKEWGVVGDAKLNFAKESTGRKKILDQVLKYDEVLSKWKKQRVADGACVLLTHYARKVDATEFFEAERVQGRFCPQNNFAIVTCTRDTQAETFITLERVHGAIHPWEKDEKLRKVLPIKLEHLLARYAAIKFYDAAPPLALVLQVVWDNVLPISISETTFAASKSAKIPVVVSVDEVGARLRDMYSMRILNPSLPESPRTPLVKDALECLVRFRLATRVGEKYRVEYHRIRGGTLDYFIKKLSSSPPRSRPTQQLDLFGSKKPS